ncbi:hypothetical protein HMPREF9554_00587 [Treponema phagedenis F0421]|nr:hypothetical protein HMPREF9554_00587 [Treponema phagedenis F0421]
MHIDSSYSSFIAGIISAFTINLKRKNTTQSLRREKQLIRKE